MYLYNQGKGSKYGLLLLFSHGCHGYSGALYCITNRKALKKLKEPNPWFQRRVSVPVPQTTVALFVANFLACMFAFAKPVGFCLSCIFFAIAVLDGFRSPATI